MCCRCICVFYIDLLCSFMLGHYDSFANYVGTKHQNETKIIIKKIRILLLRLGIGYLINIALFLIVCFVNRKTKDEGDGGFLLFCAIVIFAVCFYAFITFSLVYRISRFSSNVDDPKAEYKVSKYQKFMMVYKCLDVIFDIAVLLYSFILSDWELTAFTIAATAVLCTDVTLNVIVLMKNCCSDEERSNKYGSSENNQAFETGEIQEHRSVVIDHRNVNIEEGLPWEETDLERLPPKSAKLPDNSVNKRSNKETDYQQKSSQSVSSEVCDNSDRVKELNTERPPRYSMVVENGEDVQEEKDQKGCQEEYIPASNNEVRNMKDSSEVEKSSDFVPEPVATSDFNTSSDWVSEIE
ncbi:uncharacterized protein LOC127724244 [Mytilus californianus]|uniref:uncharacterized protein LOC127724244 n=1 Tax=Mytilus californianus TaxID=6549 RepID=UPI0022469547|nr:uncharacterized protein LOC127724244 [Mytilus californianus]